MKKLLICLFIIAYTSVFAVNNIFKTNSNNEKENVLYDMISSYALENKQEPINSKYDSVFKYIPGLNGLEVDIEASYNNMDSYFDESKIVYKEILLNEEIESNVKKGPIYKGNENKNSVTLNFNVAFGMEYMDDLLEILNKYNIKANFFVEGKYIENNIDYLKKMIDDGHLIGNHSYSHKDFQKLTEEEMIEEITKTNDIIKEYTNEDVIYFAPPSGSYNDLTNTVLDKMNMYNIMWSIDTIDWQNPSVETIKNRVYKKLSPGSIILMHPTENTVNALEDIIIEINKRGLQIERLDKFLSPSN